ncbi:Rv0909 family putative TA system antitoxin [Nocardioides plantarum]|uniref:Rv0909 family putative TA system antitoxin n=1 Tax=Nocardioides plantarum TaxID=29299 RepID=A0ABV5KB51_9ACTN|nr:Rv0909 family putative TA system antitoxin [Nocardioides plantarum]
MDTIKGKVGVAVDKHGDKIAGGIDKAAAAADKKTGGKHHDKIVKATGKAKDGLDRLDGKNDDIRDQRP